MKKPKFEDILMKIISDLNNRNINTAFGAIIYRASNNLPNQLLDKAAEAIAEREKIQPRGRKFDPEKIRGNSLYERVIESDYDTPKLKERYAKLVEQQKNNPINIFIDLFSQDGDIPLQAEDWFQKAKVGGLVFRQTTTFPESRIAFLERACKWANFLKYLNKAKNIIKLR